MSRDVGADRLVALAVRAYVNGPAIKERLSEPLENFAVPLAQDLEGSLATAAGSVRCEAGIEGAAHVIPMRSIRAKLVRSTKEKLSSGKRAPISEAASRSTRTMGSIRTPLSRSRSQKTSATPRPNRAFRSWHVSTSTKSVRYWSMLRRIDLARPF